MVNNDRCVNPDWFDLKAKCIQVHNARKQKWDVVICTNPTTVDRALLFQSEGTKMFYFVQMAENLFFAEKTHDWENALRTYRLAANKGFTAITIGQWLGKFLQKQGFAANRIYQVHNGVNERDFYQVDQDPHNPYILVEGDDRNYAKDVSGIGWAAARVLKEEFGLEVWGMAAVKPRNAGDVFDRFVLNPSTADYRELYSGARFMIKASLHEGRSLSPLEAMACGTYTVRALSNGDEDLVHNQNCLRVPYHKGSLVRIGKMAMRNEILHDRLRKAVQLYAKEHLAWGPIIDQVEAHLGINQD